MVSLVPVQQMLAINVILQNRWYKRYINVTNASYTIISIIPDNNVLNRKMCMSLSGSDHLMPYIINHVNNSSNFIFDSVHILKCGLI